MTDASLEVTNEIIQLNIAMTEVKNTVKSILSELK